ncbi:hypothetical protein [Microbacterium sp. 179-I 3D4 NHS]|uniref:hypothetical protein n=1 Tax=Microbacterium sp. 179-I 3D4 NHS TaxID=3142381 RepID=UPI0039A2CB64
MNWDRLFEDLEGQLASEWEAERAALDAESERLRIAQLTLRERLARMCDGRTTVVLELAGGERHRLVLRTVGPDWVAAESAPVGAGTTRPMVLVPLEAVRGVATDHGMLLSSLDDAASAPSPLHERMTLGFVLRDLARRRVPLHLRTRSAEDVHGTIDRAGADHLDLAVHDAGAARLAGAVREFRIVPFRALLTVRTAAGHLR